MNRNVGILIGIAAMAGLVSSALADDSMAELRTGGLVYVRSDAVSMQREDLYLSLDEVRVAYAFRNETDEDVESVVAFPMPDIGGNPFEDAPVPNEASDNFLDFAVTVDGEAVMPQLEQRALALGLDITADLRRYGIPLVPASRAAYAALKTLPSEVLADWMARGIIINDRYDVGQGMEDHPTPMWTLQSAFWWRMVFPAGATVTVEHRYTPGLGAAVGLGFLAPDGSRTDFFDEYAEKYCIDSAFEAAVKRRLASSPNYGGILWESWLSFVLQTGNNWYGPIGEFHLTVDKGSTDNLVSFCGTGVSKTGPTTFELTYQNYYPKADLDVLIVRSGQ